MAYKYSTGLRNALLDTSSLKDLLSGGEIRIYSGSPPANADAAIDGANTLLVTITEDSGGGGLSFEPSADAGVLVKSTSQTWSGEVAESGTASFFRFVQDTDTEGESSSEVRIQGGVGTGASDMNLATVALTETETQIIDHFSVSFPG